MFLKISQKSVGETCAGVFFNNVAALQCATFLKEEISTGVSCEFCGTTIL